MDKNIASNRFFTLFFVGLMLLIEIGLLTLTSWQYQRWQYKLRLPVERVELSGTWLPGAKVWTWQNELVRIWAVPNGNPVVVVGDDIQPIKGTRRDWPEQQGWLEGPIYNTNERELLRLDQTTFADYNVADYWLDMRIGVATSPDGIPAERHLYYLLTWLTLALILPVLLLRWLYQKK